jgi:hypothetical protein
MWEKRDDVQDRSHRPHDAGRNTASLSLRRHRLGYPLDVFQIHDDQIQESAFAFLDALKEVCPVRTA